MAHINGTRTTEMEIQMQALYYEDRYTIREGEVEGKMQSNKSCDTKEHRYNSHPLIHS